MKAYLQAGVSVVWVVDPYDKHMTVHRRGVTPVIFGQGQDFTGDPELPGLAFTIDEVFE